MSAELKPRVLVIDNDRTIADTLAMILNLSGFDATAAYDSQQAVDLALIVPFDHLVSAVVMPGMSGIDAAIKIGKLRPGCRVLFLSGNNETVNLLSAAHARGYDFEILPKPIHPSVILAMLRDGSDALLGSKAEVLGER